jgi:hypothetical protein
MENANQETTNTSSDIVAFFKEDLLKIFLAIFKNPISGLADYYQNKAKNGLMGSILLIAIAVFLFIFGSYVGMGDFKFQFVPFKYYIFIGLVPILIVGFISVFTFLTKSFIAKADFKKEFEMASFQAVLLSIFMILIILLVLMAKRFNPLTSLGQMNFIGVMYLLFVFYLLLLMISMVKQTLTLEKVNPVLTWYVSPAIILLSVYLSGLIIKALF